MPGFTTHYLAGKILSDGLSEDSFLKNCIKNHTQAYGMGLQGPDIFFFYLPELLKKPANSLGSKMHKQKVSKFFKCLLSAVLKNSCLPAAFECNLSYLCGFFCHYSIDSLCHPFIYKTLEFSAYNLHETKASARHRCLETLLNDLILENEQIVDYKDFIPINTIKISNQEIEYISNAMGEALHNTFKDNSPKHYTFLTKNALIATMTGSRFLYDKYFIKKKILKKIEKLFLGYPLISSLMSSKINASSYTNIYQKFIPLFYNGIDFGTSIVLLLDEYIKLPPNEADRRLTAAKKLFMTIGNNSYHTGFSLD